MSVVTAMHSEKTKESRRFKGAGAGLARPRTHWHPKPPLGSLPIEQLSKHMWWEIATFLQHSTQGLLVRKVDQMVL